MRRRPDVDLDVHPRRGDIARSIVLSNGADLLARLQEDAILELDGTPMLRDRGGRKYWYAVQRFADHSVERYLGPDTDDVRARVERTQKVNEELRQREKQRGRLARMCREGGLPRVDAQSGKVLLTPNLGPDRDEPLELPALGAHALPLRFLDFLIHQPTQAAALYRSGVLVNVPQPARYAIHKLIVATRRADSAMAKAGKDIEQAVALIRILAEDRPDELEEAFIEARDRGPSWRKGVENGARRLPSDARSALRNTVEAHARG